MNKKYIIKNAEGLYLGLGDRFYPEIGRARPWDNYAAADRYLANMMGYSLTFKDLWPNVFVVPVVITECPEPWTQHDVDYAYRQGWALYEITFDDGNAIRVIGCAYDNVLGGDAHYRERVEANAHLDNVCARAIRLSWAQKDGDGWREFKHVRIDKGDEV